MLEIREQENLSEHCRFHVGGPADYFAQVATEPELREALEFARTHGLRHFVYGAGSNLFFDDEGFRGLVVRLHGGGFELLGSGRTVRASAGYDLPKLVRKLAEMDLGGVEFLGNIPGTVGGAVVGNAGCYGRAIADVLISAKVLDITTGEAADLSPHELDFAYRHSRIKTNPALIVISATLALQERPGAAILSELTIELMSRMSKHPHEAWCAGSFFKNDSRERPAWRLITEAGMAHARIGGAAISELHANFLINAGSATSAEIIALVRKIQQAVRQQHAIVLAPEVRYICPTGPAEI